MTNFIYDRFLSDYPELNYILTLTHTINNYWSVYIENQGIKSDLYRNFLFRSGVAYLYSDDLQIEATIGTSTKTTPSSILANIGVSYRLDFHKNFISGEEKEEKELKKQEKNLKKTFKKKYKTEKKEIVRLKETEDNESENRYQKSQFTKGLSNLCGVSIYLI